MSLRRIMRQAFFMAIDRQIIAELSSTLNIRNNLTANGLTGDSLISTFFRHTYKWPAPYHVFFFCLPSFIGALLYDT